MPTQNERDHTMSTPAHRIDPTNHRLELLLEAQDRLIAWRLRSRSPSSLRSTDSSDGCTDRSAGNWRPIWPRRASRKDRDDSGIRAFWRPGRAWLAHDPPTPATIANHLTAGLCPSSGASRRPGSKRTPWGQRDTV